MSVQNTRNIKADFHHLIDEIENEELLTTVYNLLKNYSHGSKTTDFWDELTEKQRDEINAAWNESEQEANLISHNKVKQESKKWLNK